ncbi:MAG: HD domain-containing phosphohydrolase [Negativicutes bacterium]|nr:HD domain-containing phosphohydrolase [Negativicutes bacterium]
MLKLVIEHIRPGMQLARDVWGQDGRPALTAGVVLTPAQIEALKKWAVGSVWVANPMLELPPIDKVLQEVCLQKTMKIVNESFEKAAQTGSSFTLSEDSIITIQNIINELMEKPQVLFHLSQISRHHDDLLTHSVNVAVMSAASALLLDDMPREEMFPLTLGALLHDIGKVFIPPEILQKQVFSDDETDIYRSHVRTGFEILKRVRDFPSQAAQIAYQHHELMDGSGFPRRLTGTDIGQLPRIVTIANEFDNMVAGHLGIRALPMHLAFEKVASDSVCRYDPNISKLFLSRIAVYPVGTFVRLTTGELGVVVAVMPLMQHRPRLKVLTDGAGAACACRDVDLADQSCLTIFIEEVLSEGDTVDLIERCCLLPIADDSGG